MATYVNDLRLKEIATGDESGTWGASTNTNLELIAEAFSFGTEAITTNADTHTTTIADGSTDPGRSLFLKYTGTLDSACTITIGPNTVSKLWLIENATSGSQNIIIKQGSGATVTVPNGQTKAIYSDGAGSGGAMVDAFAHLNVVDLTVEDDLTITDDLTVSGAFTLTGNADLNGDLDVDGTTNLDVVDIDGAVDFASTTAHAGNATFADNAKAIFGAGSDLQIYHDGSHSIIEDSGTGAIKVKVGDFRVENASGSNLIKGVGDVASLYNAGNEKLATTATGIDVTGVITTDGMTTSADVNFGDNDKAIFGASSDLQIFHDGSHARLREITGDFRIQTTSSGVNAIVAKQNAEVELTHAGSTKLATTSTGIDVTGSVTTTDVNITSNTPIVRFTESDQSDKQYQIGSFGSAFAINDASNTQFRYVLDTNGNHVFNEGGVDADFRVESDNNAGMLFVDAANDVVSIGHQGTVQMAGQRHELEVFDTNFSVISGATFRDGSDGATVTLGHSRSGTIGTQTILNADDTMGLINFVGSDGTDFANIGASIRALVDGTPGSNDMPGRLVFSTTADGSNSPTAALTLDRNQDATFAGDLIIPSKIAHVGDEDTFLRFTGADDFRIVVGNSTRAAFNTSEILFNQEGLGGQDFRVESNGNTHMLFVDGGNDRIGIQNSSPGATLDIGAAGVIRFRRAADDRFGELFQDNNGTTLKASSVGDNLTITTAGGKLLLEAAASYSIVVNEEGIDADFRVESDGNTHMLFVDAGNDAVLFGGTSIGAEDSTSIASTGDITISRASGVGRNMIIFKNASSTVGSITTNTSATTYNTSSDQRLKENIVDAPSASDDIDAIQVRSFDWKADGSHQKYGMVAQELTTVAPEAVYTPEDPDEMMGVDYSKLVPMLIKEIQSLRNRVAELEGE